MGAFVQPVHVLLLRQRNQEKLRGEHGEDEASGRAGAGWQRFGDQADFPWR